jgi:hypothetical protein
MSLGVQEDTTFFFFFFGFGFGSCTLEDGTEKLPQNAGKQPPIYEVKHRVTAKTYFFLRSRDRAASQQISF